MSKIKNFKEYTSLHISIDDYFHMYYNFTKGTFKNLTHDNIKKMFPFVKILPNSTITRENILKGEVLLVKDDMHTILAYKNPFTNKKQTKEAKEIIKENEEKTKIEKELITEMTESPFVKKFEDCINKQKDGKVSIIFTVADDIDKTDDEILEEMNIYELRKAKKELLNDHDYKMARLVQKELYFRSKHEHVTKKSKIRKIQKHEREEEL